jgi:UDP-N-acetylmuramyl pentapeptide phosphotransferase/UDP-N-acetylglucosamine-1-phosphate transferase
MSYLIFIILIFLINFFFKEKKYLANNTGQFHQKLSEENRVPLTGGIFILIFFIFHFNHEIIFLIYLTVFFLIGIVTDLDIIKSPSKRFVIQILFLFLFVFYYDLSINDVRVDFINLLLLNKYFNIFFVLFCFLVLINGSNFIDGNNGLSIGYYSLIFIVLVLLLKNDTIIYNDKLITNFTIYLFILLFFNLLNYFYLGDNGIYLISIFTGYILIDLFNQNTNLSPYFIVVLLWYPSFELLFSMIRKFKKQYSPMEPDTNHLHQLLFKSLKKKLKYPKNFVNSLTGLILNFYNLLIFFLCYLKPNSTNFQMTLVILNISVYLTAYYLLHKSLKIN